VSHPYLYQGSFEYPSNFGHFRRYDVTQEVAAGGLPAADWDTGAHQSYDRIRDANTNNITGRKVYTAQKDNQGVWQLVDFDTQAASLRTLDSLLNITPDDNNDDDETAVINRVRGLEYDYETEVWDEHNYKLGGIMHSAPVIIKDIGGSRFADREEMAYVGDIYGMLHAICTPHGQEKWAYIPSNLLGKLKNVRGDPYATQDFAAVDASATARDLYYDHDADSRTPDAWRTVLVSPQGFGGRSIFALDVTDPRDGNWKVLWETTVPADTSPPTPGGGMGFAYRVALDKVKWPVIEDGDANNNGISNEILGYETKWMVFVATSFAEKVGGFGGLHVFAFDFETGDRVWGFSSQYSTPDNDIPGAVTTMDIDSDTFADRVYVGDINGRMWELAALDGSNPYGTIVDDSDLNDVKTLQVPLFDAGVGYPITVSPAIVMYNNHAILVFGTGGADWAEITNTYNIYGVDATAAKTNWDNMSESEKSSYYQSNGGATTAAWTIPLAAGEKVWSTPTIAAGQIWIVTSTGSMESDIPGQDSVGGSSKLRRLDLNGVVVGTPYSFNKKVRGSLYVSNKHVYMTTFDNEIIQLGDGDFAAGNGNRVVLKSWQHQ
jgi:Tfp pilus tip-associated adhesin PilY1